MVLLALVLHHDSLQKKPGSTLGRKSGNLHIKEKHVWIGNMVRTTAENTSLST